MSKSRKKRTLMFETMEPRILLAADLVGAFQPPPEQVEDVPAEVASVDGTGHNLANPEWGSTNEQLLRLTTAEYGDGISTPAGEDRPSAREVSNAVAAQVTTETSDRFLTDVTWLWGQFIDHDIDLTGGADPAQSFNIEVPEGDIFFDPDGSGDDVIGLSRSIYDTETGTSSQDPREQINQITAFLDGSVIYGSDAERANELRTFSAGQLKTSEGDLLPFNEAGLENAGGPSESLFLAGDVRANENAALTAMQTLWVREHNYWANELAAQDPSLTDEELYQGARSIITSELQAITFNEYLPALLGDGVISEYEGYDSTVNPGISNVFSTAAYRFGHSMLSSELLRLNNDGTIADEGNLALQSAFFAPGEIVNNGIDSILLGSTAQVANEIDTQVVDDVRNFLFGAPGSGGFDLASLNIQRGRDHGLADYNQVREDLGLQRVTSFSEITSNAELASQLEALYGDVDNIDVWVGGLAEDHLPGSSTGELISTILIDQFERIRDGDSQWYENVYSGEMLQQIENTSLSDVIQRNTGITDLRENVFYAESVFRFELADHRGSDNVVLNVNESQVEFVDARSGKIIESRPVEEVSQVQFVGTAKQSDRLTIDVSLATAELSGGIIVSGGQRGASVLTLLGNQGEDSVVVDGNNISVNGMTIEYTNFDEIHWHDRSGVDSMEILNAGSAELVVVDGPQTPDGGRDRHDHHEHDHHRRDGRPERSPTVLASTLNRDQMLTQNDLRAREQDHHREDAPIDPPVAPIPNTQVAASQRRNDLKSGLPAQEVAALDQVFTEMGQRESNNSTEGFNAPGQSAGGPRRSRR